MANRPSEGAGPADSRGRLLAALAGPPGMIIAA
jgi:hypothetical protein